MDKNNLMIPISIVIAGVLIAGGIYYGGKKSDNSVGPNNQASSSIRQIDSKDHIRGNPKADVVLIAYSDLECPYCKYMHESMNELLQSYGNDKIAIVYRHFWAERTYTDADGKTQTYHPSGGKAAEASECVAELGGNDKFWSYLDKVFASQPESLTNLSDIAVSIGIEKDTFDTCLASGKYTKKVANEYTEGIKIGVTGTPSTFIFSKGKFIGNIPGAIAFDQLKAGIDPLFR